MDVEIYPKSEKVTPSIVGFSPFLRKLDQNDL